MPSIGKTNLEHICKCSLNEKDRKKDFLFIPAKRTEKRPEGLSAFLLFKESPERIQKNATCDFSDEKSFAQIRRGRSGL